MQLEYQTFRILFYDQEMSIHFPYYVCVLVTSESMIPVISPGKYSTLVIHLCASFLLPVKWGHSDHRVQCFRLA